MPRLATIMCSPRRLTSQAHPLLGPSGAVLDAVGLVARSLQLQAQNPGFHSGPGFHLGGGFHSGGVSTSAPCRGATTASAVAGSPGMIGAL